MDLFSAVFKDEDDLLKVTRQVRDSGYSIYDIYTPYAVHGLDDAMGLKPSKLSYLCFGFAFLGLIVAILSQYWIGSIDWPINVGGKPFNSLPAYLPVTFELTVLFGGVGIFFAFLFKARLRPGKTAKLVNPHSTDYYFILTIEIKDSSFDSETVLGLCRQNNAVETKIILGNAL